MSAFEKILLSLSPTGGGNAHLNLLDMVFVSSSRLLLVAAILSAAMTDAARAGGDAARGQALFSGHCAVCHTTTPQNKVGPGLAGVYGRTAGTAPKFRYSKAMTGYGRRWDDVSLDRFLASPSKEVPGTTMAIVVLEAPERADIIAYLRGLGDVH